jgi:hypothetical protein
MFGIVGLLEHNDFVIIKEVAPFVKRNKARRKLSASP